MLKPSRIIFWALLAGALLRIYGLGTESLWLDEATTVRRATEMSFAELRIDAGNGTQQPLYFWISKVWCGWFGTGEFWLRFPAMLFGVLSILIVYHLGRKLFSQEAGMWAAILMAINPYLIYYSQEARPYTLFVLLAMISWYYLLQLMRTVQLRGLAGYVIFTTAALYTHPYGGLLLVTHFAGWLIYRSVPGYRGARREWKYTAGAVGVTLLLFLPQVLHLLAQFRQKLEGHSAANWIPEPGFMEIFAPLVQFFMDWKLATAALLVAVVAGLIRAITNPKGRPGVLFCVTAGVIFTVLPWLVSVTLSPIYITRYTMPLLPLLLIVVGWAIAGLELLPRRIVVVVLVALSIQPIYHYHTMRDKTPWREATSELASQVRAGDVVVWVPWYSDYLADYYFKPPGGVQNLFARDIAQIPAAAQQARRVWLIGVEARFEKYETPLLTAAPVWQRSISVPVAKDLKFNPEAISNETLRLQQYLPAVNPEETLAP